jgi:lysophospholipase L1-like esterase
MRARKFLLLAAALVSAAAGSRADESVVCFGDSITKAGYPKQLEKLLNVPVVNAGVNGNTTRAALARIDKDVLTKSPSVVVIFFGTNDCRLAEPRVYVPVPQYEANLAKIVALCRGKGANVVLCTPPPIDPEPYFTRHERQPFDAAGGLEKVLGEYRAAVLRVAEATKAPVVDLNQRLAKEAGWRAADGVHPTPKGSETIAGLVADAVRPLLAAK